MKLATTRDKQLGLIGADETTFIGLPQNGQWPLSAIDFIRESERWQDAAVQYASSAQSKVALNSVNLDAPVRNSQKLICIGKNYAQHAAEMGGESPEIPVVFSKFASAINYPEGSIALPPISSQVDFEAELVVVIGRRGKHIPEKDAMDHVFGYCCGNDISARDWQKGKPGGQWLLGKTFDGFAPLGPYITTKDEIADPHDLKIQLRLNGQTMQDSSTSHLIFRIDFLIAHLSKFVTLEPGDLIFTGTPAGVGAGRNPQIFLKPGDQIEIEIQSLGVLKNSVQ